MCPGAKLAGSGLEIHDRFYIEAEGLPQFGSAQHFSYIMGISHLDVCAWSLQPLSKCADFSPKSNDCP